MADDDPNPHQEPALTELPPTLPDLPAPAPELRPDARVGNYRLIRIIGGGMDLVWEAEQDQPRRIVALKLLKTGPGMPARVEPDVLARLSHPNIAQVYEAGTVRVGAQQVPFFAMEYVAGARTITQYAEQERVTRRQRLELFIQVCDALHHGHQRGFLHRDLKPDNILVDSAGRVKVIDFGIAHAIGIGLSDRSESTRSGVAPRLIGTPQYMSPEQVKLAPEELDRRTDVYALGLVLYELLCGKPPYHVTGATVAEITHTICDEPPALPSKLDAKLRGDLEAILLTALAKSRDDRYSSAAELAEEQRRVLDYEPIRKRSDSRLYRFGMRVRRFVARHRIATILLVAIISYVVIKPIDWTLLRWTPANAMFEGFMTSGPFARSGMTAFDDVRIVAITPDTDLAGIAKAEGLPFDPDDKTCLRALHGRLQQKLRNCGAKVVAFDIMFGPESKWDEEFVRGTKALAEAKIPVVVGMRLWQLDHQGMPNISPAIARTTRFGGIMIRAGDGSAWQTPLVYEQNGEAPVPSFALVVAAAARHPQAQIEPHVDTAAKALDLYYMRIDVKPGTRATAAPADRIPFSKWDPEPQSDPEFGLSKGARAALFVLDIPSPDKRADATIDYGRVFAASDEQLREWFAGKVIVIGDKREGGDPLFDLPGWMGKEHGMYAHAIAVQMLLRGLPIRLTSPLLVLLAGLIGAVIGGVLAIRSVPRWGVLTGVTIVLLVIDLVAYQRFRYIHNPVSGIVVMWFAAELAAWAARARRRALLIE